MENSGENDKCPKKGFSGPSSLLILPSDPQIDIQKALSFSFQSDLIATQTASRHYPLAIRSARIKSDKTKQNKKVDKTWCPWGFRKARTLSCLGQCEWAWLFCWAPPIKVALLWDTGKCKPLCPWLWWLCPTPGEATLPLCTFSLKKCATFNKPNFMSSQLRHARFGLFKPIFLKCKN